MAYPLAALRPLQEAVRSWNLPGVTVCVVSAGARVNVDRLAPAEIALSVLPGRDGDVLRIYRRGAVETAPLRARWEDIAPAVAEALDDDLRAALTARPCPVCGRVAFGAHCREVH